jgi:hypothetical protein
MKNIIFPSILAVTVMGCASVDSTTNHTPTDTRKAELETNLEAEIETLAETLPETPSQAEALYNEGKHAEAFDMHYLLATRAMTGHNLTPGFLTTPVSKAGLRKTMLKPMPG